MTHTVSGTLNFKVGNSTNFRLSNNYLMLLSITGFKFEPPLPKGTLVSDIKVGNNSQSVCPGHFNSELLDHFQAHDLFLDKAPAAMDYVVNLLHVADDETASKGGNYVGRGVLDLREERNRSYYNALLPFDLRGTAISQVLCQAQAFLITPRLAELLKTEQVSLSFHETAFVHPHQDIRYGDEIPYDFALDPEGRTYLNFKQLLPIQITQGVAVKFEFADLNKSLMNPQHDLLGIVKIKL